MSFHHKEFFFFFLFSLLLNSLYCITGVRFDRYTIFNVYEMRRARVITRWQSEIFFSTIGESYFPPTWLLFRRCLWNRHWYLPSLTNARRRNGFELRHRNRLEWINGTWSHLPWHVMQTRVKERQTISLDEKVERARRVNGASTSRFATRKRERRLLYRPGITSSARK